jgi:hypothetical protein
VPAGGVDDNSSTGITIGQGVMVLKFLVAYGIGNRV